jgi:general stress protein YciG
MASRVLFEKNNGVRMQSGTRNRGFASMDREKQREIARKGGRAAHEKGTAHEFTTDEARAAGRKGGERVSANRDHMSRIGRLGGKHSAGRRQVSRTDEPQTRGTERGNGNSPDEPRPETQSATDAVSG